VTAPIGQLTRALSLDHLLSLTDRRGIFEHAEGVRPRLEHGYCVDDVARGLLVAVRETQQTARVAVITETYLRFLEAAIGARGRSHNRMSTAGTWTDKPAVGDWWGRSLWALGTAAVRAPLGLTRGRAVRAFLSLARKRSPHRRAMVFAALGAAELVSAGSSEPSVRLLLREALADLPVSSPGWHWPEDRLRYGNASLAEALIHGGNALGIDSITTRGLRALDALLDIEMTGGHLSVTGTDGRAPGESAAQFDQQPIEVAAIADAAARAYDVTGDSRWLPPVRASWAWFLGDNDAGVPMVDLVTGAGFDGLQREGRNDNRGAESTLAAISTNQQARRLGQL
jgi:hypothetical protein